MSPFRPPHITWEGFVVLAIVSLEGILRPMSHVASRPMNYVVLMCNTSSAVTCVASQCVLRGLVLQCAQCTHTVHAH